MLRWRSQGPADLGTAGSMLVLVVPVIAALLFAWVNVAHASGRAPRRSAPVTISITSGVLGPPVAAGFVGVATEYWDVEEEVGTDPTAPDLPFEQAVRNLAPYGNLSFRVGGDSADWAWWPISGVSQPRWVRWTMTPTWAAVTQKLANDLQAHMIFGINMEANNPTVAAAEFREIASQVATSVPVTYEVGNEPELYPKFPFYHDSHGHPVHGRPTSYSYSDMTKDWDRIAAALPGLRLAGPGYSGLSALPYVPQFLTHAHGLSLLTVHSYPLRSTRCGAPAPQESMLFAPLSLQGLAAQVSSWTTLARRHATPLRVDEMNAVTCGGMPVFSSTFGPALWALNILPLYAQDGVQGVNFQTKPASSQNLIQTNKTLSGWKIQVQPEYYGLLAFSQLTPPGSHVLKVSTPPTGLFAWAVRTPSARTNVVLTNVTNARSTVSLRVAGARGAATVERLQAAAGGLGASTGVTLGGQTISPTTGQLTGTPVSTTVPISSAGYDLKVPHGTYTLTVPADSAAIVSFNSS